MAIKPEEAPAAAAAKVSAGQPSRRRSELDLTRRNVGPVWRQYLRAMGPGAGYRCVRRRPVRDRHLLPGRRPVRPGALVDRPADIAVDGAVQEICDRTALTTGTGLGELAVRHLQRAGRVILAVLLGALIVANGLNIATDLVAIGSGMQLLQARPLAPWAGFGVLCAYAVVLIAFAAWRLRRADA